MHGHRGHSKICTPLTYTVITNPGMDNKIPNLVCEFLKPITVIPMNEIHEVL